MEEEASEPLTLPASVKRKLQYGWVIFGLTFANLTIEGGAKNSQPVFLVALHQHFGRSLTLTSALFSVTGLVGSFSLAVALTLGSICTMWGVRLAQGEARY